jgi:GAF domain-containing protein
MGTVSLSGHTGWGAVMPDTHAHDETRFFARLLSLADTLVTDFDLAGAATDLVDSCVEFLPVDDAGIMLVDEHGQLRVLASTSEETRFLEMFELQRKEGPCLDAFASEAPVLAPDFLHNGDRWPSFSAQAVTLGIRGVYALPMRLHEQTIGVLNLFCESPTELSETELHAAHRLATMATLGILTYRRKLGHEALTQQLQRALDGRVVIEQAKGMIAARAGVTLSIAFEMLRAAARSSRRPLADVAQDITLRGLDTRDLAPPNK